MKTEADGHKPRNHLKLEEAEGYPPESSEGAQSCRHLRFGLLASGTTREYISVVQSYPAHGNLSQKPYETSMVAQIKGL